MMPTSMASTTGLLPVPSETAQDDLSQLLSQYRTLQTTPLIPDNPLAQIGAALQGFSSGVQGRSNPAIEQAMQQRKMAMDQLREQANMQFGILQEKRQREHAEQEKLNTVGKLLQPMFGSADPDTRKFAGNTLGALLQKQGISVPPEFAAAIGETPLKPAEIDKVLKLQLSGADDQAIASTLGKGIKQVQALRAIPDTPTLRASLKMKTTAQLDREIKDDNLKDAEFIRKTQELKYPGIDKDIHAAAYIMTKGAKNAYELSPDELAKAFDLARQRTLDLQYEKGLLTGEARAAAKANEPIQPKDGALWVSKDTLLPLSTDKTYNPAKTTSAAALAAGYVRLPSEKSIDEVASVQRLASLLNTYQDIVNARSTDKPGLPALFPRTTGNRIQDAINKGRSWAHLEVAAASGDQDAARLKAMFGQLPGVVRAISPGIRVVLAEIKMEGEALGLDRPNLSEEALAKIGTFRERLGIGLGRLGLVDAGGRPLTPKYKPKIRVQRGKEVMYIPEEELQK